jgi:16S rRNA (cytosine967-C5)-methyltransferase
MSDLADRDPARGVALTALRAVRERDAYANLVLPALLAERGITGRDAALATELTYGTARTARVLDEILAACATRAIDPEVGDLLRLGAYQVLRTRIPSYAAVATTVTLARADARPQVAGFVNAVLRRVAELDWSGWTERLGAGRSELARLALRYAHPEWIAAAFRDALGGDLAETEAALAADDERPATHLVARPGRIERAELAELTGGAPGPYSPYAVRLDGGDPGGFDPVRDGRAAVQDEGSQLCAIAVATAPLDGGDERWLDMCAGPGGKAALLAALAAPCGARLTAVELRPHRAELVRTATEAWDVEIVVADAAELPRPDGGFDRILLDAPCTGLGALRRRPEARWRRTEADLPELTALQARLLMAAVRLVRPGGLIGYVTCSPHLAETAAIVGGQPLRDARPAFPAVPGLGPGPTVQLWPHQHGTDAMFCAFIQPGA